MTTRAIDDTLWVRTDAGPRLVGGSCTRCGTMTFPRQHACSRCTSVGSEDRLLPTRGVLWSYTVQAFPPKAPPYLGVTGPDFVPYGVGYVELGQEVVVEARLSTTEGLEIGMAMELALVPFATDPDGADVVTFAFAPAGVPS